jgi:hypothetical protein
MRKFLFLLILLCLEKSLHAQYVYTIKADSVKITNTCDTAELIIENHTQNVPGFLFNKGRGRTEFRKPLLKIDDNNYLVGADTLKILQPVYTAGIGLTESPFRTFNNNLITGIAGGQTIIGSSSGNSGLEIRASSNTAATAGADIRFTAGNNGALETMRILNNGNVGIGTAIPNRRLVLKSPSGTNEVGMSMVGGGGSDLLTLDINQDASATMNVPSGSLSMFSNNGIIIASNGGHKVNAASGNVTIILPLAGSVFVNNTGITYIFKRIDNTSNSVTILRTGSDTIDGGTSFTLTSQYEAKNLTATAQAEWSIH